MCISNGGQSDINEINMNKTNGSAKMKVSAIKSATTHTRDRYLSPIKKNKRIRPTNYTFLFQL